MPDDSERDEELELWREFHKGGSQGPALKKWAELRGREATLKIFYDTDDIFRREIDGLKEKMKKGGIKPKQADEKVEELLIEAKYRRYIASFENMKENFEARKKEMAKVKEAFS